MTFLYPYNASLFVIILGVFFIGLLFKKRSGLSREIKEKLKVNRSGTITLKSLKRIWFLLFSLLVVALCRPVIVEQDNSDGYKMQTGTLAISLDISKSMLAKDVYPSRLEFAKVSLLEMFKHLEDFKVALSAFSKDVFIVSPFTHDKETVSFLLTNLDTTSMSSEGSSIRASLMGADKLFSPFQKIIKDVLIVTDGADGLELQESITEAKKNQMRVHLFIIGSKEGSTIVDYDNHVIKDRNGNNVITKRDDTLAKLSEETGGFFVMTNGSSSDLNWLLERIKEKAAKEESYIAKKRYTHELFYIPLFLALTLLWYVLFQPRMFHFSKVLVVLCFVAMPYKGHADIFDFWNIIRAEQLTIAHQHEKALEFYQKVYASKQNDVSQYNLANSYYRNRDYEKAAQYYQEITTTNKTLEYERLHNLGNAFYKLGRFDEAVKAYQDALVLREEHATRFNLEYILERLDNKMASEFDSQQQQNEKSKKDDKKPKNSAASEAEQEDEEEKDHDANNTPSNQPPEDKDGEKWERTLRSQKPRTQPQPLIKNERLEKNNDVFW